MKRIFWHCVVALAAGLCLRLFFVLKWPANSGDTILYEQMATNWLQNHVYAMEVHGQITPVDLRMPGYPMFLALVYAITSQVGENARLWVMVAQALVDLWGCLLIALLAALLQLMVNERSVWQGPFVVALWLAALCPFTANYSAVQLTEVFAMVFTTAALIPMSLLIGRVRNNGWLFVKRSLRWANDYRFLATASALLVGIGTLFRPEAPLLLLAFWIVLGILLIPERETKRWLLTLLGTASVCALPLLPWTLRNAITLHEFQPLAPKNSNLPGELVPYGFMSWEKTWLYRFRDVYLVPWKLNDEAIQISDIPSRAFDSPEERARVASILEPYNTDLTLTADEDAAFARLAKERTARNPLRSYLWLPAGRAITMWFTPRIELIPISGTVFPLLQSWRDDKIDQGVTVGLFLLNIAYMSLAIWGALRLWRSGPGVRPALILLLAFILLRTAFLTTLETPEPRYVLVCFPVLIALAAQAVVRPSRVMSAVK